MFFFGIVVLQQDANLADIVTDVAQDSHDSRDVAVLERQLHD